MNTEFLIADTSRNISLFMRFHVVLLLKLSLSLAARRMNLQSSKQTRPKHDLLFPRSSVTHVSVRFFLTSSGLRSRRSDSAVVQVPVSVSGAGPCFFFGTPRARSRSTASGAWASETHNVGAVDRRQREPAYGHNGRPSPLTVFRPMTMRWPSEAAHD